MTRELAPWENASPGTRELMAIFEGSNSPPLHELGVVGARSATSAASRFLQGPATDVAHIQDLVIERDGTAMSIRIYHPSPAESLPLIVYMHGGGWVTGDLEVVDGPCRRLALGTRSVVVSIDYRRSPETRAPGAVTDLRAAVEWCHAQRALLGARESGLSLVGDSAGAHLIACLLVSEVVPAVTAAVLMYPPISPPGPERSGSFVTFATSPVLSADTMEWFWHQHLGDAKPDIDLTDVSSVNAFPRTLLISAGVDVLRDEGLEFAAELRSISPEVQVINYPDLAHGFFWMDRFIPEAVTVVDQIADFLGRR